ncbi:MAG: T9SS type A sorting domain-containing protein [Bacteroidetes bacterium]|nr:T9SS type A sorting domain-containing protein [Bacteroidota bacterium]
MKNYLLLILVLTTSVSVKAQQAEVIATSGDFYENSSGSLSWTLGEVVIETLSETNFILTQGFQQSKLTVTAINDLQTSGIELSVYPNPTNSFLFIEVKTDKQRDLQINLFDLNGKLILQKKITGSKQTVNMQNYKPATYILKVTEGNKEIRTYQIVKH